MVPLKLMIRWRRINSCSRIKVIGMAKKNNPPIGGLFPNSFHHGSRPHVYGLETRNHLSIILDYSDFKLFTGFISAALIACILTVTKPRIMTAAADMINISALILIR